MPPPSRLPLRLALMLLLAACLRTTPSYAQDVVDDQDAQLWVQVNAQVPVTRTWAVVLEGQPRWSQNFTHYDQIVLRVGTTVRLTPVIQLGAAYALVPRRTVLGALVEHQSYQQVVVTLPRMGRWSPQFRLREDQRVLDQWGDAAHRVREQFRVTHPVPKAPAWTIVLHEQTNCRDVSGKSASSTRRSPGVPTSFAGGHGAPAADGRCGAVSRTTGELSKEERAVIARLRRCVRP